MMDAREREEQYRVSVEWLYDMEDYNEWMHEEDYEVTLALTFMLFLSLGCHLLCS